MDVNLSPRCQNILEALISRDSAGTLDQVAIHDIPIEVYHHPGCPGVSSTTIKKIVQRSYNYASMWSEPFAESAAMAFGTAFHAYRQGLDFFASEYSIGKYAPPRKYLSFDDFARLETMSRNVDLHPECQSLREGAKIEWTFFSRDPATGVLRKARPDFFIGSDVYDWKTTEDASPAAFSKSARRFLYRISARYYMEVMSAVLGYPMQTFNFIAVESQGLHDVAKYPIHEQSLITAQHEIEQALSAIARSKVGGWTGYTLNQAPLLI